MRFLVTTHRSWQRTPLLVRGWLETGCNHFLVPACGVCTWYWTAPTSSLLRGRCTGRCRFQPAGVTRYVAGQQRAIWTFRRQGLLGEIWCMIDTFWLPSHEEGHVCIPVGVWSASDVHGYFKSNHHWPRWRRRQ